MQTPAYKPVRGEVRKTPARPPRRTNPARLCFGLAAAITMVLGFVLAPGWWVFTVFSGVTFVAFDRFDSARRPRMTRGLMFAPNKYVGTSELVEDIYSSYSHK